MNIQKLALLFFPLWALSLFLYVAVWFQLPLISTILLALTLLLTGQGALSTYSMLYTFLESGRLLGLKAKKHILPGKGSYTFSLIVPARNEEKVIADTLKAMSRISYPKTMYEVLVVVRADDAATLAKTEEALAQINRDNFRLITIDGEANTKSYSLNIGAHFAKHEIVAVFDAEDEPHPDILTHVSEAFAADTELSIVQAGVQLINVGSTWFSAINCLEYYFWYKSVLPMMAKNKTTFLGGNSVFIKKEALLTVGKWDEGCLTEDADIGVRLSNHNFKTGVIYEENLSTLEETPVDELAFIKQRSRWDFGYLQILFKGQWLKFKSLKQQYLSLYILTQPLFRHVSFVAMVLLPLMTRFLQVPVGLALLSYLPAYFLVMQLGMYALGLYDLRKYYNLRFPLGVFITTVLTFFPYQLMLFISSLRALVRLTLGKYTWEKTVHQNSHRLLYSPSH
ncbi:MAG: glycosyltransferase [Patescibacteria group bacterium]|jgi:cellulose synthase/poly-beta-1,6-N-acetylglucosamine synthase-like glycosyltransferase